MEEKNLNFSDIIWDAVTNLDGGYLEEDKENLITHGDVMYKLSKTPMALVIVDLEKTKTFLKDKGFRIKSEESRKEFYVIKPNGPKFTGFSIHSTWVNEEGDLVHTFINHDGTSGGVELMVFPPKFIIKWEIQDSDIESAVYRNLLDRLEK